MQRILATTTLLFVFGVNADDCTDTMSACMYQCYQPPQHWMQRCLTDCFNAKKACEKAKGRRRADASDDSHLPNRLMKTLGLANSEDESDPMRRAESWGARECYHQIIGEYVPHGTVIPGGYPFDCSHHTCQDGSWKFAVRDDPRCVGDSSTLGVASPASSLTPAGSAYADARVAASVSSVGCPLPTLKGGRWTCPDQSLTLAQRRTLFDSMRPFDEINGVKLDDHWPATAGLTKPLAGKYEYDYEGIAFKGYRLSRPTGERAPIHYHEVSQLLCLEYGKIMVLTDQEEPKTYQAPDCYMMPAYTKVSVISLETKVENCLLRVPKGGLDWVVIEPKYYDLQGQWTEDLTGAKH